MIDLGTPFAPKCWILVSFSTDFGSFFATDFFRPPRLPRTKQLDRKLQEHASKFKNMKTATLNKDASTKTPILNVQIAKRQQLHQTPIDKYGGGGARAAWRIRIRRPRLAERGFKACRIFSRISADSKASDRPRPIRRPHPQIPPGAPVATPQTPNCRLLADFLPIENSSKIRLLKNPPKTSKIRPSGAQTSIWGSLLGSILASIFMNFQLFRKTVNP